MVFTMSVATVMRRVAAWFRSHPLTTGIFALIGCVVGAHYAPPAR